MSPFVTVKQFLILDLPESPVDGGLGLHISREVLAKIGYDLLLAEGSEKNGATFIIEPRPSAKETV